jgi:hypothetical protein
MPGDRAAVITPGDGNDYVNLETSGRSWRVLERHLARIFAALQHDAAAREWLASTAGHEVLNDVFENPAKYFAVAEQFLNKDGSVDHVTEASTDDVPGYRTIINLAGFETNPDPYNWDTILHELAHILRCEGFHQNDGGEGPEAEAAQDWNAALLQRRCGQTLGRECGKLSARG